MPSAYPTRSAEWVWDYETAGGKRYSAVLTDVALGGVWEPAVEDLADITREQAVAALATLLPKGRRPRRSSSRRCGCCGRRGVRGCRRGSSASPDREQSTGTTVPGRRHRVHLLDAE
jgi:hypothetical protein